MAVLGRGKIGLCACLLIAAGVLRCRAQGALSSAAEMPEAPLPQQAQPQQPDRQQSSPQQAKPPGLNPAAVPCLVRNAAATMAVTGIVRAEAIAAPGGASITAAPRIVGITLCVPHMPVIVNWYARFLNGPQVKALTPLEKAHLAARNLIDPFNLLTIAGEGAFAVGLNSHSADGPGFHGYGNYIGVSFTQDMVGEFFGTFLIPSIAHQDPHYHRMPNASIKRRIVHCITQIAWTEGDNGQPMINYADVIGYAADESINNLFVPGLQTSLPATTARYELDLATAPIDNFITEFLPDIARHLHVRIVLVQRIINQVARTEPTAGP